jgi:hypothetical protein
VSNARPKCAREQRAHQLDAKVVRLVKTRNRVEARIARHVLKIERGRLFRFIKGCGNIKVYAQRRAGWGPSKTDKILALARKLPKLPHLKAAFLEGNLKWTKAYAVSTIATRKTDAEWTQKALTLTTEALHAEIAKLSGEPVAYRRTMKYTPQQKLDVDAAVLKIQQESKVPIDYNAAVAEACRRSLAGGEGVQPTLKVIYQCVDCGKATREAREGAVEFAPAAAEAETCVVDHLDITNGPAPVQRRPKKVTRNFVNGRDHFRCRVPECPNQGWVEHHHHLGWKKGHDPRDLFSACSSCHRLIHEGRITVKRHGPGRFTFFAGDEKLGDLDISDIKVKRRFRTEVPAPQEASAPQEAPAPQAPAPEGDFRTEVPAPDPVEDAVKTLVVLQYPARQARDSVQVALRHLGAGAHGTEAIVKAALRNAPLRSG